jgi:hypothetical protein
MTTGNSFWGNADFYVVADNRGFWPLPERDSDGIPHYRATVIPFSETEYKNLLNNVSLITVKRGLGAFDIEITVEAGQARTNCACPSTPGIAARFRRCSLAVPPCPRQPGRSVRSRGRFRADQ